MRYAKGVKGANEVCKGCEGRGPMRYAKGVKGANEVC